jgi:general stress protein 26
MEQDQTEKVRELLKDFKTAMLVTQATGRPGRARPMAIARVDEDCSVWFFTARATEKVGEIRSDNHVLVTCQDERSRYLSLSGKAELIGDRGKARELWRESYKTWFPAGLDDPELLLIRVQPSDAEYWDNQGVNGIRYLFEAAKAYISGVRPKVPEGQQHGKVGLDKAA